ncbi:COG3014 family protein [Candidatus Poribacteria bacterium]
MNIRDCLKILSILLVCALFAGCATYGSKMEQTRLLFSQGKYDDALKKLDKTKSGSSKLLYLLEKGMILHYACRYEESNNVFEEAEILAEDLYTKSVSKEAGAFLTSDNILPYEGEKFERALIHYYRAFNYIYLKLPDDALVECRKVSFLLQRYLDESEEGSTAYPDDAFMHYLAGILFEWQGERNDAFISYRKAEEAYGRYQQEYGLLQPLSLKNDLLRTASALGFSEEYDYYLKKYGDSYNEPELNGETGELILVHENGFAPNKEAIEVVFPILKVDKFGESKGVDMWEYSGTLRARADRHYDDIDIEYMLRISIPTYESTRPLITHVEVLATGNPGCAPARFSSETVEDVEAIAMKNFGEEEPKILLKTIARGGLKYLAFKTAKKKKGEVAGLLVNVFNIATENADTRSWLTLPNSFGMARMSLPPGKYDLQLSFRDDSGREVESTVLQGVDIRSDDFTFLNYRTFQ